MIDSARPRTRNLPSVVLAVLAAITLVLGTAPAAMATERGLVTEHTGASGEGGAAEGDAAETTVEKSSIESVDETVIDGDQSVGEDSGDQSDTEQQATTGDAEVSSTSQSADDTGDDAVDDGLEETVRGNSAATIGLVGCLIESSKDISYVAFLTDGAETDKLEGINATSFDLTGYTADTVRVKSGTTVQTFAVDCATTDTDGDDTDDDEGDTDDDEGDTDDDAPGNSAATITVTDCLIESSKDISYVAFLTDGAETDKLEGINATSFDLTGYTADTVRVKSGTTVQTFAVDCATTDTDGDDTGDDQDDTGDDEGDTGDDEGEDEGDAPGNSAATITVTDCLIESSKDISYVAFLTDGAETDKLEGINATSFDLTGYTADTVRVKSGTTVQTFAVDCATTDTDGDDTGDDQDDTGDDEGEDEGDAPGNSEATVTLTGCLIESTKDISYIGFWSNGQEIHRLETIDGETYDLADYAAIGDIDHIHVKSGTTLEQFDIDCDEDTTGTDGDDTGDDETDTDDTDGDDTEGDDTDDTDDGDKSEATVTLTGCLIESTKDISYIGFWSNGQEIHRLETIGGETYDLADYAAIGDIDHIHVKSGTTLEQFDIDCDEDTTGTDGDDTGDDETDGDDTDDTEGDDTDDDQDDTGDDEGEDEGDAPGNSEATVTLTGCLIESTKDISYIGFWSNGQEIHRLETIDGETYDLADYAAIGDIDHIHVKSGTTLEQFDIDCDEDTTGTDGDDTGDDETDTDDTDGDDTGDDDTGDDQGDDTGDDETDGDDTDDTEGDDTGDDETGDDDTGDDQGDDEGDDTGDDDGDDTGNVQGDDDTTGTDDTDADDSGDTTGSADNDDRSPVDDRSSGSEDGSDEGNTTGDADDNRSPIDDVTEPNGDALPTIPPALGPVLQPVNTTGGPAEGVEGSSAEGDVAGAADAAGVVEPAGDLPYTGAPPLALLGLLVMGMASALRISTRRTA